MSERVQALTEPPEGYTDWLAAPKGRIHALQQRAALAANAELLSLSRQIGHDIFTRQAEQGCGAKAVDKLARDLKYVRAFAQAWSDEPSEQQPVTQIPWDITFSVPQATLSTAEQIERE